MRASRTDRRRFPDCPFARTALVLQGGGALGAYQAGAYQALSQSGYEPDWVAGISIGGINAAIIAGNEPKNRLQRLTTFWETVTSMVSQPIPEVGEFGHTLFNAASAATAAMFGLPGFFRPRWPPAPFMPQGAPGAISVYDTAPLRATLADLIDLDLINSDNGMRLSLGAVNVRSANFVYFDNAERRITLDHVMASAALPPGFPPIEIEGELFWDGGLVSNTPLSYLLDAGPKQDMLIFQVDLFSTSGPTPRDLLEVEERRKDITFSSRTRLNTDAFREKHQLRRAIVELCKRLPADERMHPEVSKLCALGEDHAVSIVHLIYRRKNYESQSKDYEFSRASMREHWQAGVHDTEHMLRDPQWLGPIAAEDGVRVFDATRTVTD